ncbi:MAG: GAF domain-containing protein [Candidatus Dadabacteria bacterium]|nr:MAG: GAF domain-containing protein [Candidatus Dadabacteria bacterium]
MAEELILPPDNASREEKYKLILPQLESLLSAESDPVANMANCAAVLKSALEFFWVGFYRLIDGEYVLGPFQGPLACTRIKPGRGVCGTAAERLETIIVPDVDHFPGHIACSSESRSEIVVPLVREGKAVLLLDVDSRELNDFSEIDRVYLEQVVSLF